MYQTYLITGATGFLGRAVLHLLLAHSCRVLALVMDKDPLAYTRSHRQRYPAQLFCRRRR